MKTILEGCGIVVSLAAFVYSYSDCRKEVAEGLMIVAAVLFGALLGLEII